MEIEEDAEATRAVDWDKAAADTAYRAQVERAQERQRILQEQLAREVVPQLSSLKAWTPSIQMASPLQLSDFSMPPVRVLT